MNHWISPSCDSRTGASHRRRGAPCQDASGFAGFHDAAGTPIQVLVVSDGHGGSRYVRSDVGARLACEVAMRELRQALGSSRVADPGALDDWRGWLAGELPGRIVSTWLREVECHWRALPASDSSGFSPAQYGATLGVLLLTPLWWAHTGLGDWDLVRIDAAGGEGLLSEEPDGEAGGEATFSLCLPRAERQFAPRTALYPLREDTAPLALLLATDGLRKSCGSDADFLTLSRYLVDLSTAAAPDGSTELADALDHISRQGSGDDISVAVARWGPLRLGGVWPGPGHSAPARLVQPSPEAPPGDLDPAAMAPSREAGTGATPADRREARSAAAGPAPAVFRRADHGLRPARGRASGPRSPVAGVLVAAAVLLGVAGAGLLIAAPLGLGPFAGRRQSPPLTLTPQQRRDLQRQVAVLCSPAPGVSAAPASAGDPQSRSTPPATAVGSVVRAAGDSAAVRNPRAPVASSASMASDPRRRQRIAATLATRASVFQRLQHADPGQIAAELQRSQTDALSALIAYSVSEASLSPRPSPPGRPDWIRRLAALVPSAAGVDPQAVPPASPLSVLRPCPELVEGLRLAWQQQRARGTAARSASSPQSGRPDHGGAGPSAFEVPLPERDASARR